MERNVLIMNYGRLLRLGAAMLALLCVLSVFSGCAKVGDYTVNTKTVMKVGDYKISFDEYRYFYLAAMNDIDGGDSTLWYEPDAPFDKLKQATEGYLCRKYAMKALIDEYDVKLTKDDKEDVNNTVKIYTEEQGGEEEFRLWLCEAGLTGRLFREQYEFAFHYDEYLREILFTGIDGLIPVDAETVNKDINENFYHYTWIFIPFGENDNYGENRKIIDEAHAKLESGEDFYKVADEYSEWTGKTEVGIYATLTEKIALIEETVLALEIGEYSRVLALEEGHAIMMRLRMDGEYINDHYETFVRQSATRRYHELIERMASEMEIKYKDYYESLTHKQIISTEGYK